MTLGLIYVRDVPRFRCRVFRHHVVEIELFDVPIRWCATCKSRREAEEDRAAAFREAERCSGGGTHDWEEVPSADHYPHGSVPGHEVCNKCGINTLDYAPWSPGGLEVPK